VCLSHLCDSGACDRKDGERATLVNWRHVALVVVLWRPALSASSSSSSSSASASASVTALR